MMVKKFVFTSLFLLFLFSLLSVQNVQADSSDSAMTWIVPGYHLQLTLYTKNISQAGYQNASVFVQVLNTSDLLWYPVRNATVNGTMVLPNGTVDYNFPFVNHTNGTYSYWYNLSINGSYWLDVDVGQPTFGNATINDTIIAGTVINNFTVTPSSVAKNQWCTFAVTVCNFGSYVLTNVTTTLHILNASGSVLSSDNLTANAVFNSRDCQTLTTQKMFLGAAFPVGQYVGQINVTFNATDGSPMIQYYEDLSSENQSFNITAAVIPPTISTPSGFGGAAGARMISAEARKIGINFKRYAILKETSPGKQIIIETVLTNLTNETKSISAIISGVPNEWLSLKQQKASMGPFADDAVQVLLNIPEKDVVYGDYFVTTRITTSGLTTETFFVLRIKYYGEDYEYPMVFKSIDTDFINNKTLVGIEVYNSEEEYKYVEVIEEIPKSLAPHVNTVDFGTEPTEILVADPKVSWMMLDLGANEKRDIKYEASFATEGYEPYVYWPVEQVNVLYPGEPEKIKISQVHIPSLIPGAENNASFLITNTYPMEMDIELSFDLPYGWKTSPSQLSFSLSPQSSVPVSFLIIPRTGVEEGTYSATIIVKHEFGTVSKSVPLIVGGPGLAYIDITGLFFLALPWIGLVLFLIVLIYVCRSMYRRRSVGALLKEDRKETLENIRNLVFRKR